MELRTANEYLADPRRLDAQYNDEGYLFFRNVLDPTAVATLKRDLVKILIEHGYVLPGSEEPVWTGKALVGGKAGTAGPELQDAYDRLQLWERFVEQPKIRAVFEKIAGEPIEFIPVAYFRIRLPGDDLILWHQDGFYAQGINARTAWVPLMHIDPDLGGLQIAAGMNKRYLHDETMAPIPVNAIPEHCRRGGTYEPGDVVIFSCMTPHTGLPNVAPSRQIRLSLDVRFIGQSQRENVVIGNLVEKGHDFIVVTRNSGERETLKVTDKTTLRQTAGAPVNGVDLSQWDMKLGEQVMASRQDGVASYVRLAVSKDGSRKSGAQ
jgi:hypothetical protein